MSRVKFHMNLLDFDTNLDSSKQDKYNMHLVSIVYFDLEPVFFFLLLNLQGMFELQNDYLHPNLFLCRSASVDRLQFQAWSTADYAPRFSIQLL